MARTDQEVRDRLFAVVVPGDPDSFLTDEALELIEEMETVDQRNLARLDEIVSERGWPGAASVGSEASTAAMLILEHADIESKERYLPLLRQAVRERAEEPARLAQLEDEVSVANTGYQIYGTEISLDTGAPVLVPIVDPTGLDARREEMGLPPIEEYLRQADAALGTAVDRSALAPD